jgi:hypothetical protein
MQDPIFESPANREKESPHSRALTRNFCRSTRFFAKQPQKTPGLSGGAVRKHFVPTITKKRLNRLFILADYIYNMMCESL